MTYKQLIQKCNYSNKAYQGMFAWSKIIKNLDQYLIHKNKNIDFSFNLFYEWYNSEIPVERYTKSVFFCGSEFYLKNNVFCPRHETELIIEELNKFTDLKGNYIDICSGSGIIGITFLKRNPNLKGVLLDIDKNAIENIKINLKIHKLNAKVIQSDWYEHLKKHSNYQIISANFPYLDSNQKKSSILDPETALYSDKKGWIHYENFLNWLSENKNWKIAVLECNEYHESTWKTMKPDFNLKIIKDLSGAIRVAVLTRKPIQS